MKDKEKQIDEIEIREMARVFMTASCKGSDCENCLFIKTVNEAEQCCVCLKALYNAGYRKLTEDSVVLSREEWECLHNDYAKALYNARQNERKETAEKFAKLIEFHSISKRDESGYETFTISNLCMREILREQFGFTNEELETMWEIKE